MTLLEKIRKAEAAGLRLIGFYCAPDIYEKLKTAVTAAQLFEAFRVFPPFGPGELTIEQTELIPAGHVYREYVEAVPEWREAVECNRDALDRCETVVLMLPCGNDAHADAFYALGRGKNLIVVGQPKKDDRTPTHLWADVILDYDFQAAQFLAATVPE